MNAAKKTAEPSLAAHAFEMDVDVPPDFKGTEFCRCGKAGRAGDEQHPEDALLLSLIGLPPVPDGDETPRILGEGGKG